MTDAQPHAALQAYYERWQALDSYMEKLLETYTNFKSVQAQETSPKDKPVASAPDPAHPNYLAQAGDAAASNRAPEDFPRRKTILQLLASLRAFARDQFNFFCHGFDPATAQVPDGPHPRLQVWDEFPPEDVLTGILLQIQNDLDLIQRAASQRIFSDENARQTLDVADHLAWLALQPAIQYGLIDEPATVLTHFQKSAEFYTIPYANVAIIAIPFTCASNATLQDFLAIPHEVGHYVYRHPTQAVKDQFDQLRLNPPVPAPYQPWIKAIFEELCADIYGCVVGGPVMALDFQALSLANSRVNFAGSDWEHPNPALRPLVYCEVLKNKSLSGYIDGRWWPVAGKLAKQWDQQLLLRHLNQFALPAGSGSSQAATVMLRPYVAGRLLNSSAKLPAGSAPAPLASVIHNIVDAILQQVQNYILGQTEPGKAQAEPTKVQHKPLKVRLQGWADRIDEGTEIHSLYEKFTLQLTPLVKLAKDAAFSADADIVQQQSWQTWLEAKNDQAKSWNKPNLVLVPSGEVLDPDQMEPNTWGSILYADGWITGGPSRSPAHPSDNDSGHPSDNDSGHPSDNDSGHPSDNDSGHPAE